jgi:hypothetical protein
MEEGQIGGASAESVGTKHSAYTSILDAFLRTMVSLPCVKRSRVSWQVKAHADKVWCGLHAAGI